MQNQNVSTFYISWHIESYMQNQIFLHLLPTVSKNIANLHINRTMLKH